jgi:hypothetical protein
MNFSGDRINELNKELGIRYKYDSMIGKSKPMQEVYALAANMGGIGFIESNKAIIVRDNTLINMHTIEAARVNGARRFLYTSSACIYPGYLQKDANVTPLKEDYSLDLPTFEHAGLTLLKRQTLVIRAATIEHVFYPVFPSDRDAAQVLDWLRG